MLTHSIKTLSVGAVLLLSAAGAWAQAVNTPSSSSPLPANETVIGVSPAEAKEAIDKAVPKSDTGTLVRTAPSVKERAQDRLDDGSDKTNARDTAAPRSMPNPDTAVDVDSQKKQSPDIDAPAPAR